MTRLIAVDWSGTGSRNASRRAIALAEVRDGRVVRLERTRDRDEMAQHLVAEIKSDPDTIVGLDFGFAFPEWFAREKGCRDVRALWALVAREGEQWLRECPPPFWGRKPCWTSRIPEHLHFRRTERDAPSTAGIAPKSIFQIGLPGGVGTGSIRGMPMLLRLAEAGWSIWPFDSWRSSTVVEIYPRLLTGPVNKSDSEERAAYLARRYPTIAVEFRDHAVGSEDAFDALVSALVMDRHRDALQALKPTEDPIARLEGLIWSPVTGG